MFTMNAKSTRMTVSAAAALAIVSFNALVLDQAHIAAAPRGTVEVGELTLAGEPAIGSVTLPEVTVIAKREQHADALLAATTELPEVIVVAKRVAQLVARADQSEHSSMTLSRSTASALLK